MVLRVRQALSELRRRKVYRAAAVYAAVGLGVLGAAEVILDPLGLTGVRPYVVVLVILGFPIALVLAWIYELRPESPAPSFDAPSKVSDISGPEALGEEKSGEERPGGRPLGKEEPVGERRVEPRAGGPSPVEQRPVEEEPGEQELGSQRPAEQRLADQSPIEARSIAVLPFDSMSPDPEGDYFADGIAEELINTLARQEGLRVVARTSAFAFRGERVDVREIGRRLNVTHIIEGSVRRTDQALRITAQLINTEDGYHVWSEQFDREHGDVFKIQEEISGCVLQRLQQGFCEGPGPSVPTAELSAYDAYLKGRHGLAQFNPGTIQEAIDHFEAAIRRDDHFAPALAGLAEALTMQAIGFSDRPVRESMPRAEEAANRALELDPGLPEAHLALALARMYWHWDYSGAKEGFDRALELNPNFAEAHLWEEFYWTYVEHDFEKAVAAIRRAQALSPLDSRIGQRFATVHYIFGKLVEAEELFREALAEDPEDPMHHLGLGDTLSRMGQLDEAVSRIEEAVRLGGRPHAFLGMLAGFYGLQGNETAARAVLDELEARQEAGYAPGFWVAVAYSGLGRMDDAFRSLDRAVKERDSNLLYLIATPRDLRWREDPRFGAVLERIGLGHLRQFL